MRIQSAGKALVLLTAAWFISGSQCARVDDRALAPETIPTARDKAFQECIKECRDISQEARQDEQERFVEAKRECRGNPDCHQEENARHQANLEQIEVNEEQCKSGCHEQGTGGGGQ